MDPSAKHNSKPHPVIDTLEQTRLEHHEGPFPHPHPYPAQPSTGTSAHPLEHVGADVTDQILQQAEAVPLTPGGSHSARADDAAHGSDRRGGASAPLKPMSPGKAQKSNPNAEPLSSPTFSSASSTSAAQPPQTQQQQQQQQQQQHHSMETPARRLSTTATLPSATWQPLASKSSNQLPSKTIVDTAYSNNDATASAAMHEYEHDRPSVLPEIVPGFRGRFADIHHATLNSVKGTTAGPAGSTDTQSAGGGSHDTGVRQNSSQQQQQQQQQHPSGDNKVQGSQWTGGTMFPAMPGFIPFGYNSNNSNHKAPSPSHQRRLSAAEEAHRKLSKSSILYESSDLAESTTQLTDEDYVGPNVAGAGTSSAPPSKTMVQGGHGGRRWSHELSPEKAGLVGSVIEAAGLIKDVVMDKIESSDVHLRRGDHHVFSPEERQAAARVAFGGSEETGDQTIYLEKLQDHLRRETADKARAAAGGGSPTSKTAAATTTSDVLGSAPHAGEEHHKSIFHLAANPEVKKSLLLDHPEALGYHARDPTLAPLEESTLAAQHRLAGNNTSSPQDVSKTRR
ncbi:hypothetical protein EC968_009093 [Mortierella alpina]|nr:hypothetical protein EC968_009093 [Mortierella alpina]